VKQDTTRKSSNHGIEIDSLPIDYIVPDPSQPRKTFSESNQRSLARSLRTTGQVSPIVVKPGPEGKYVIVVGERRWRAARDAGLAQLECVVRNDIDEQVTREMQFAENYQRDDVPPLEQARSLKEYMDRYAVSQSELSRRTGIPQRTISDRLILLSLPASVHTRIEAGEIGPYEAVKIAALRVDQQEGAAKIVSSGLIRGRMLDKLVKMARANPERPLQYIIKQLITSRVIGRSPARAAFSKDKSAPDRVELKKETNLADVKSLFAIIDYSGIRKQKECSYFKKTRVCFS
jgi:ParB/RepB/Spo0J family partition protein